MKKYLLSVALSALVATPAAAANLTGPRLEGRIGWDKLTLDASYDDGEEVIEGSDSDEGVSLGGELGFDLQVSQNLLVGGYAGADFSSVNQCEEVFGNDSACLKFDRNLYLGARGGFVTGKALLYVKGGYSRGRIKASYDDGVELTSGSANRDGFHLGAGVEIGLSDRSYVKAEYVRTNYDDYGASEGLDVGIDTHRDQIVLGVGLRF